MNRIAVVTGTTHGIGRVTARELARAGLTVIMLCQDLARAAETQREIADLVPGAQIHVIQCDLSSFESSARLCTELRNRFPSIEILINNAGIVSARQRMSVDGFELTFATNHLGPFLLTQALLDRMDPQHGRIINVSSCALSRKTQSGPGSESTRSLSGHDGLRAIEARKRAVHACPGTATRRHADSGELPASGDRGNKPAATLARNREAAVQTNHLRRGTRRAQLLAAPRSGSRASRRAGTLLRRTTEGATPAPLATDRQLQELLWARSAQWTGLPALI